MNNGDIFHQTKTREKKEMFDVTKKYDNKLWKSRNLHRSVERDIVEA